jgi:hypothetical protein
MTDPAVPSPRTQAPSADEDTASIERELAQTPDVVIDSHPFEMARAFVNARLRFLEEFRQAIASSNVYRRLGESEIAERHANAAVRAKKGIAAVDAAVAEADSALRDWFPRVWADARREIDAQAAKIWPDGPHHGNGR